MIIKTHQGIKKAILDMLWNGIKKDPYKKWIGEKWFYDVAPIDWGVSSYRIKYAITELISEGRIKRKIQQYSEIDKFKVLELT